jgi:hypothetical protein
MRFAIGARIRLLDKSSLLPSMRICIGQEADIVSRIAATMWRCKFANGIATLYESEMELLATSPQAKATQAKKQYGVECPCGIKPSMCDYHRS